MHLTAQDIAAWDKRYRAAFINSLTGFKPANLVGTRNAAGVENLAIMSSAVHLGSHPPLVMLIVRPDEAPRHSLANILETGQYTLNHVGESFIERAHQTAARYDDAVSEFTAVGLTPAYWPDFTAPYVSESCISFGLALREHQKLAVNGTHMVIGEVQWVRLPEAVVHADGYIDIEMAGTVAISGLDSYHLSERRCRLHYAKPDLPPRKML